MRPYLMPRIRLMQDNRILRPSEAAEQKSRKHGTAKRAGYAMAARFVRRLEREVVAL